MNKKMIIAVIILSALSLTTTSFAQMLKGTKRSNTAKAQTVSGKIVSIDQEKLKVVIKNSNGVDKTVVVDSQEIASLKVGEEVIAVLAAGSNKAQSIKKMVAKKAS